MRRKVLRVTHDAEGSFISRENRFLGIVDLGSGSADNEEVHIRDPGRLEEILYPGNRVLVKRAEKEGRRTDWDLLAGKVNGNWIFVNSGYHRQIFEKILKDEEMCPFEGIIDHEAEKKLGDSRIDFALERKDERIWVEVKGCTLAVEGKALFPDAPTARGRRHIEELMKVVERGGSASVVFLVFRPDSECFAPHEERDPDFTESFERAVEKGMSVHPISLSYEDGVIYHHGELPLCDPL